MRKIIILAIALFVFSGTAFAGQGWYSFMQNKEWYPTQGESSSSSSDSSSSSEDDSLIKPSSTPTTSTSTTSSTNTTSTTTTQPGQSNWYK